MKVLTDEQIQRLKDAGVPVPEDIRELKAMLDEGEAQIATGESIPAEQAHVELRGKAQRRTSKSA